MKPNEIKTGDTILVSSHSWLARQIQRFQKIEDKEGGKYNHAMMAVWIWGDLYVCEADKRGVRLTRFSDYYNSNRELLCLRPTFPIFEKEYAEFMLPYCGSTRYDFYTLFVAFPVKILTGGKVWIGPKKENGKGFNCGGWCAYVYNNFMQLYDKPQEIAPVDLYLDNNFIHLKIDKP